MKTMRAKDFWLLVPCAAPALVLFGLPAFKAAAFPPFKPTVSEVHFAKTYNRTNDADRKSFIVTIYLSHTGPRPEWWGKSEGVMRTYAFPHGEYISSHGLDVLDLLKPRFIDATGKVHPSPAGLYPNLFDAPSQRYVIHCDSDVFAGLSTRGARFLADIKMKTGTLKVDVPVKLSPPLRQPTALPSDLGTSSGRR